VTFDGGRRGHIDTVFDGLDEFWLCDESTKQVVFQGGAGASSTGDIRSFRAAELVFSGEWLPTACVEAVVEVPLEVAEDILTADDFSSQWEKRVHVSVQVERLVAGAPARIFVGPGFTPDVRAAERLLSEHVRGLRQARQITEHIDVPKELLPALHAEADFESRWQERTGMAVRLGLPGPGGHGKITLGPGFRSDVVKALGLVGEHLQELADLHCPNDDLEVQQGNLMEHQQGNLMEHQHDISSDDLQAQLERLKAEQESDEADEVALTQQASTANERIVSPAQNSSTGITGSNLASSWPSNTTKVPKALPRPHPQILARIAAANARNSTGAGNAPSATAATTKKTQFTSGATIGNTTAQAAKARLVALQAGGLDLCAAGQEEAWPTPSWLREDPGSTTAADKEKAKDEVSRHDEARISTSQTATDENPCMSGAEQGMPSQQVEGSSPAATGGDSREKQASGCPVAPAETMAPAPESSGPDSAPATDSTPSGEKTIKYWVENQSQFANLPSLPDSWIRVKSKDESQIYYVCLTDGTTTLKMPTGSTSEREEASSPQEVPCAEPKGRLPPGWTERVSRSTGQTYYWNASTGISQFEVPEP